MANPEHVEIVKQGAMAVRRWREENPGVSLDLGGTDLHGIDLHGADLRSANLREADLSLANLYGAFLYGADLRSALLSSANLREARLGSADLAWAWLDYANLSRANLDSVRGAEHAYELETVRFIPTEDIEVLGSDDDALHFETCSRPWPER